MQGKEDEEYQRHEVFGWGKIGHAEEGRSEGKCLTEVIWKLIHSAP